MNTICQICSIEQSKYTCPQCLIKYCSVKCFKQHKENCQKQTQTQFLSVKEMNDETINADLRLLSDTQQFLHFLENRRKGNTLMMKKARKNNKFMNKNNDENDSNNDQNNNQNKRRNNKKRNQQKENTFEKDKRDNEMKPKKESLDDNNIEKDETKQINDIENKIENEMKEEINYEDQHAFELESLDENNSSE